MAERMELQPQVLLRPIVGGDVLIDERWNRFRNHRIPYWMLYINGLPGAAIHLDGGRIHALSPDAVHLIPAWVRFDCQTTAVVPHLWVVFDLVGVPGSLVRAVFPSVRSVPLGAHLAAAAARLRQALSSGATGSPVAVCAASALLYAAMGECLAGLTAAESARLFAASAPGSKLAPALALIEDRLDRSVGNRALGRACGLSEHHFIRQFRLHVGQTPAQYRLERRIAEGARRLASSDQAIAAIALACGFADRQYFSRIFSRLMGLSPAAYRRKSFTSTIVPASAAAP